MRKPVEGGAAGIAEPEQSRALVERLPGRVVDRRAEHAVAVAILDVEQERVAAAREEAEERRLERVRPEVERRDVALQVVDGREREADGPRRAPSPRSGPTSSAPTSPGPCVTATASTSSSEAPPADSASAMTGDDELEVAPRRDLGDDAAVARVQLRLRRDDVRADLPLRRDERRRGLVAGGLDPEDHALSTRGCTGSFHMIRASSRLSV